MREFANPFTQFSVTNMLYCVNNKTSGFFFLELLKFHCYRFSLNLLVIFNQIKKCNRTKVTNTIKCFRHAIRRQNGWLQFHNRNSATPVKFYMSEQWYLWLVFSKYLSILCMCDVLRAMYSKLIDWNSKWKGMHWNGCTFLINAIIFKKIFNCVAMNSI